MKNGCFPNSSATRWPRIDLCVDVGAIGDLFAVSVIADHFSGEVVGGNQMLALGTGHSRNSSPDRKTTEIGAGIGTVATARAPRGR